jgi:predicted double-glycine peptidase
MLLRVSCSSEIDHDEVLLADPLYGHPPMTEWAFKQA